MHYLQYRLTIRDYEAPIFKRKEEALEAKMSCVKAMDIMLKDTGSIVLPAHGWAYKPEVNVMKRINDNVCSLSNDNRSFNLVTDMPNDMFLPVNEFQSVGGFTAWYVGPNITKECAVVRYGGDNRNEGRIIKRKGKEKVRNPRYTKCVGHRLSYSVWNDTDYYASREIDHPYNYNRNYIKDGGAHGLLIDYSSKEESEHSCVQDLTANIECHYINRGVKIKRRVETQAINTSNIKLTVYGAKQYYEIHYLKASTLTVLGQEHRILDYNPNDPNYKKSNKEEYEEWQIPEGYLKGEKIHANIKIDDRTKRNGESGRHKIKRQYHVNGLDLQGWKNINNFGKNDWDDSDLNDSVLMNHSDYITN